LPVANLPDDFDGEPMDGKQYLFTVRRDARQLPLVTRVANPYEVPESSIVLPPCNSSRPTHPNIPSEEWRASFEKHFRNFRKNAVQPTIHIHIPQTPKHKLMPDKTRRDCWWAFLAGHPESDWNPPKKIKPDTHLNKRYKYRQDYSPEADDDKDREAPRETWHINNDGEVELAYENDPAESLPTPSGTPAPSEPSIKEPDLSSHINVERENTSPNPIFKRREPTPTLAAYLDHRTSLHLLMYFTYWINTQLGQSENPAIRMTETHARWIFVLLSRIEDHISADDMSLLRNLARASLALLKELMSKRTADTESLGTPKITGEGDVGDDMSGRSCWIIVTAVAGVWGQRDLWMDAEAMLGGLSI